MKKCLKALVLSTFLLLSACHTLNYPPPTIGMSEKALIARSGEPTATYQDGNDRLLEYSSFWAQHTYMFRFGPDDRLKSWDQVLTDENFAKVQVGETTKRQVLLRFGRPVEKDFYSRMQQEVWSLPFQGKGGVGFSDEYSLRYEGYCSQDGSDARSHV